MKQLSHGTEEMLKNVSVMIINSDTTKIIINL